ncbi:MAG TPA: NAD(P)/FAD-dependent oxidoreductase [Gaiellaceae bacterium]|jgi:phytoene dehydrogenase-like protein|nr:NAD(P)/FAD-dependent oxidoreductase [Gaiellaceae bacterium]
MRAVVVGSGPNGLAGALVLARAGLDVEVFEAEDTIGGGLRSFELTLPGFVHDVCSAIHPLGENSPFFRELRLPIEWVHPPAQAAHPLDDGTAVVLEREVDATAAQLGVDAPAYRRLVAPLVRHWDAIEPVLLGPLPPPPRALARVLRTLGPKPARDALSAARTLAERAFQTERARAVFAGHSAHSMLPLERRPSAGFGLSLIVLGHVFGWGFPRGGAQRIADALVARLAEHAAPVRASCPVDDLPEVDVVLADVAPRELLRLARGRFPERYGRALRDYRHGPGAFKLDWALSDPIPWRAPDVARAGTVHLGGTLEEISASEWAAWSGRKGPAPFVLLAQHTRFDPTRAPESKHTAWAYCHVPNGSTEDYTNAIEAQVERFAPGFRETILARSAWGPRELEAHNRNLVGGDINTGAMDLGQLFTRPARKLVPYRTPLEGVYLCSAATPPGGGVHGMCGASAARIALEDLARRD